MNNPSTPFFYTVDLGCVEDATDPELHRATFTGEPFGQRFSCMRSGHGAASYQGGA